MNRPVRTVTEVAAVLGVSRPTVRKLIADGHLEKLPLTGRTLVTVASLENMLGTTLGAAS